MQKIIKTEFKIFWTRKKIHSLVKFVDHTEIKLKGSDKTCTIFLTVQWRFHALITTRNENSCFQFTLSQILLDNAKFEKKLSLQIEFCLGK